MSKTLYKTIIAISILLVLAIKLRKMTENESQIDYIAKIMNCFTQASPRENNKGVKQCLTPSFSSVGVVRLLAPERSS